MQISVYANLRILTGRRMTSYSSEKVQLKSSSRKNLEELQLVMTVELQTRITVFQTPNSNTWLTPAIHAQPVEQYMQSEWWFAHGYLLSDNKTIRFLCLCMSLEFTPNCAASDNQALKCTVIQGP